MVMILGPLEERGAESTCALPSQRAGFNSLTYPVIFCLFTLSSSLGHSCQAERWTPGIQRWIKWSLFRGLIDHQGIRKIKRQSSPRGGGCHRVRWELATWDGSGPGKSTQPRDPSSRVWLGRVEGFLSGVALALWPKEHRTTYVSKEKGADTCYLFIIMNKSVSNMTLRLSFERQKKKSHYKMQSKEIDFLETPQESNVWIDTRSAQYTHGCPPNGQCVFLLSCVKYH